MINKALELQKPKATSEISRSRYYASLLRRNGLLRPHQSLFSASKYDKDYVNIYGKQEDEEDSEE